MNMQFSESQARLLSTQLRLRIEELEREAARTDRRDLQHAMAGEIEELKDVLARVNVALGSDK
jgi:hypothetical protein